MRFTKRTPIPKGSRSPAGFRTALMSDTKWRKMFSALDRPELQLRQAIVKFVDNPDERIISMPKASALHPPKPFIDTSEFGPVSLREIEWIEFPAQAVYANPSPSSTGRVPPHIVQQDIAKVETILAAVGKFRLEHNGRGLRIIGHVR